MTKIASATDPLWFKDAVIYELHVRAFADSNNDGIGDFPGLLSKLDYLQDLGVTCLWLLPFFPSPLRDDGYDISNYTDVNPSYGTLDDFKAVLEAAHSRGMQITIELVVNHTSDQHPWFKASRLAPPGSPERDMYVWSDTDQKYKGARIIFTDTEKSNWTWDETAKAYYWHRFFSHQPDLNYDNPLVMQEVLKAMRFWLDMGVDGLRMDAIPYLCERDGTSCENLDETHAVIRALRAAIDAEYANRLILAEANQWPADVRPYFGDGDECHMAFHFPLMPRIFMALRQEDRQPITDIMARTPNIPDTCQWALFLRNHDELTLEMVTDDERDYMYFAYSADPRMRINVGIRRRLAPLMDNNRRRIELLNSLLLSFPGTPIIYYGDEIGMGDNIYLGDRNGVRTPMQWSSDRNAGFSRCDPARLYLPVVMDPICGYQAVNVEAQISEPSSLLNWTRNMIGLRKLFQVFGRGSLTFLNPSNRKILAYLRDLDRGDGFHETVLCVANLSRFAQPVTLDLAEFAGFEPVEMLGYVPFPTIGREPYALTLAPYSFLWLELQTVTSAADSPPTSTMDEPSETEAHAALPALAANWDQLLTVAGASVLEPALREWLPKQRWFGSKARKINSVQLESWVAMEPKGAALKASAAGEHGSMKMGLPPCIFFLRVTYFSGPPETYQLPLGVSMADAMDASIAARPEGVVATILTTAGNAQIFDATALTGFQQDLLRMIAENESRVLNGNAVSFPDTSHASDGHAFGDREAFKAAPEITPAQNPAPLSAQPGEAASPPRDEEHNSAVQDAGIRDFAARKLKNSVALAGRASTALRFEPAVFKLSSRVGSAEQSNTSILFGDQFFLKLYRHVQPEENPDVEVGRFLTEVAKFPLIPAFLGEIAIHSSGSPKITTAVLQHQVENRGDGWQWFMQQLAAWLTRADKEFPAVNHRPSEPVDVSGSSARDAKTMFDAAALLGKRTAEMHLALASSTAVEAFSPVPISNQDLKDQADRGEAQIKAAFDAVKIKLPTLDDATADVAALMLSRRPQLVEQARLLSSFPPSGQRIRIHGDFHLGQVLKTARDGSREVDFVFIDFEGEPARPIEERRRKQSPLRDVAGMLRSFSYVAWSAVGQLAKDVSASPEEAALESRARWWQREASARFHRAYKKAIAQNASLLPEDSLAQRMLQACLLEKALYEVMYELNNRPAWLRIPMEGILDIEGE